MKELFGISMDTIMVVLLGVFALSLVSISYVFIRNRVMFKMGLRNIVRRRAPDRPDRRGSHARDADHHRGVHDRRHARLLDLATWRTLSGSESTFTSTCRARTVKRRTPPRTLSEERGGDAEPAVRGGRRHRNVPAVPVRAGTGRKPAHGAVRAQGQPHRNRCRRACQRRRSAPRRRWDVRRHNAR